eukprot:1552045-Pyramimonas_sp.AAC.1
MLGLRRGCESTTAGGELTAARGGWPGAGGGPDAWSGREPREGAGAAAAGAAGAVREGLRGEAHGPQARAHRALLGALRGRHGGHADAAAVPGAARAVR